MSKISLRLFLLLMSGVLIIIPTTIVSTYNTIQTTRQINDAQVNELINSIRLISNRAAVTREQEKRYGSLCRELIAAKLSAGGNLPLAELKALSASTGAIYSVLYPSGGDLRGISTKEGGTDIIEGSSGIYAILADGRDYAGRRLLNGQWHKILYSPSLDSRGSLEYVTLTALPEDMFFSSLFDELSREVIGRDGYYYILNPEGDYVLSYNRQRDGENIVGATDASGKHFIQEMIDTSMYVPGINVQYYSWQNKGESQERPKVAAFVYIEELDWIIGASDYVDRAEALIGQSIRMLMMIVGVSILLGLGFSFYFTHLIYRSFTDLQLNIEHIARGDLTAYEEKESPFREILDLQNTMSANMVPKLNRLIEKIDDKSYQITKMSEILEFNIEQTLQSIDFVTHSSDTVKCKSDQLNELMVTSKKSTDQIANAVKELQGMVSDQSSSVAEISASIEESTASLNNVSRVVNEKLENARDLTQQGERGKAYVKETEILIGQVNEDIAFLFEVMGIINSMTEETQLLAMNAAIEAAHAGKQGRGFAIVANEMRSLANTTAENGNRINETLTNLTEKVRKASEQSSMSFQAIQEVTGNLMQFTGAFQEIANSTEEISLGSVQILEATSLLSGLSENTLYNTNRISESVGQLSGAVETTIECCNGNSSETNSLIQSLSEVALSQKEIKQLGDLNTKLGSELSESLQSFKYITRGQEDARLVDMVRAHQLWVERIDRHINGEESVDTSQLVDHHACELGQWLEIQKGTDSIGKEQFKVLMEDHEKLHKTVEKIVEGEESMKGTRFLTLKDLSHQVIRGLLDIQSGYN